MSANSALDLGLPFVPSAVESEVVQSIVLLEHLLRVALEELDSCDVMHGLISQRYSHLQRASLLRSDSFHCPTPQAVVASVAAERIEATVVDDIAPLFLAVRNSFRRLLFLNDYIEVLALHVSSPGAVLSALECMRHCICSSV